MFGQDLRVSFCAALGLIQSTCEIILYGEQENLHVNEMAGTLHKAKNNHSGGSV